MKKIRVFVRLMRIKHYIKNGLIFVPTFFAGTLFENKGIYRLIGGFLAFSIICSSVYVLNDVCDAPKDRMHKEKCVRPIASGIISIRAGLAFAVLLFGVGYLLLCIIQGCWFGKAQGVLLLYMFVNIAYSIGMKNVPIIDVMILASGFLLRIMYGGALGNIWVSEWLYLTVMMISLYLGVGKRKNEMRKEKNHVTRKVLRFYTEKYLEKIMQMCMSLGIAFYALWSVGSMQKESGITSFMWTIPLVLAIVMRYEMIVEKDNYGDPTDVFYSDKVIVLLTAVYIMSDTLLLYGTVF